MSLSYAVVNDEITVTDSAPGAEIRKWKPDGLPVKKVLPLPESDDCIVLIPYEAGPMDRSFQNLLRCRADGSVVWRADLPDRGVDTYVHLEGPVGRVVIANSWSCYRTLIDPETGKIRSKTFTK